MLHVQGTKLPARLTLQAWDPAVSKSSACAHGSIPAGREREMHVANCSPYRSPAAHHQLHAWWVMASGLQARKINLCTGQLVDGQRGCAAPAGEASLFPAQVLGLRPCKQLCRRQRFAGHEYHLAL